MKTYFTCTRAVYTLLLSSYVMSRCTKIPEKRSRTGCSRYTSPDERVVAVRGLRFAVGARQPVDRKSIDDTRAYHVR